MEYILYCDESSGNGPKFSDFFGGCLIDSRDLISVTGALNQKKQELNLLGEIKWTKVTAQYLDRYIQMMDLFFDFVHDGKVKVRIMFRRNEDQPSNPQVRRDKDEKYFKLYYQFIKWAFGLRDIPAAEENVYIRIYLDQLPDKKENCEQFKDYVRKIPGLPEYSRTNGRLSIRDGDVAEVCSHDHVLLQCTDIVLGAMYYKLNGLNKETSPETDRRGKRTIAKEKLYQFILKRIQEICPRFNIGITTGTQGCSDSAWKHPYRHWRFIPK